jgi:hypothetical protein
MSCAPPVVTLLLLLLVGGATAQSCFYRGTPGTCQQISTCPYAYEPSMLPVNTTGCQSNPVRKKKKKKPKKKKEAKTQLFFFQKIKRIQWCNVVHELSAPR